MCAFKCIISWNFPFYISRLDSSSAISCKIIVNSDLRDESVPINLCSFVHHVNFTRRSLLQPFPINKDKTNKSIYWRNQMKHTDKEKEKEKRQEKTKKTIFFPSKQRKKSHQLVFLLQKWGHLIRWLAFGCCFASWWFFRFVSTI